jgi:hypothetical protein
MYNIKFKKTKLHGLSPRANYMERATPLVGEVSANFCGWRVPRSQRNIYYICIGIVSSGNGKW